MPRFFVSLSTNVDKTSHDTLRCILTVKRQHSTWPLYQPLKHDTLHHFMRYMILMM